MKKAIVDAINDQIQVELDSAYVYLAMSARMEQLNLPGFAAWLRTQWQEETIHALKFFDFMVQRDAKIELKPLGKPDASFKTPLQAFESVLKHERFVTESIHKLYALAVKEGDYPLQTLLQWFIDEQVEEEDAARAVIDSLKLVGESGPGLFMLDREMGARKPESEE